MGLRGLLDRIGAPGQTRSVELSNHDGLALALSGFAVVRDALAG
jgi:hypothetical protein